MTNLGGIAAITAWGIANWDYFENDPKKGSEGWFLKDTDEGGADKCAHFYFSYTLSHILSDTFDHWGYSSEKAALLGSFSSFAMMSYMEFGDSFSNYGFSHEDFFMNLLGCTAGYLLYANPNLSKKIDFRIEYIPTFNQIDFFSDYNNMKFLMAVKLGGFESLKNTYAEYIEFHLGYYTRGYSDDINKERNIYIGIGINLSKIFTNFSMTKTAKVFNYYQLPYTYISIDKNLNN
ncbi:MAG: YfiM family protein [Desulfobacula sp.]|uniref:DUF2279 domain-containing protein n=1 Tax=Desulfobacula sp. TaxID=2593537 RepID=UPI0025BA6CED|nr:DUF2279 domain-containing protein [Desulfobacula sp.]MCD4720790.1 YfiM family protein [Desulfobacula sp.]